MHIVVAEEPEVPVRLVVGHDHHHVRPPKTCIGIAPGGSQRHAGDRNGERMAENTKPESEEYRYHNNLLSIDVQPDQVMYQIMCQPRKGVLLHAV